jgi:hypothetical protein
MKKQSLRNRSYDVIMIDLKLLLMEKERGDINHIYVSLRKTRSKKIPDDLYEAIIGKNELSLERRSLQKGNKVELLSILYNLKLEVEDINWTGYKFQFLIWDIDRRKGIEIN